VPGVELSRDGEVEDGVAQKLEPLVRRLAVGCPVRMGEDVLEALARERVDQALELIRVTGGRRATGAL
jgi:hypothetical protein